MAPAMSPATTVWCSLGGGGEGGREEGDMMGVSMGLGGAWVGA